MMIELKGRGFALLATDLSFVADNRATQESIRRRLGTRVSGPRVFRPGLCFRSDAARNGAAERARRPSELSKDRGRLRAPLHYKT